MKVGDLIEHCATKKLALIVKEMGPYDKKPYYFYKLLWVKENEFTTAPLSILVKLWRIVDESPRNINL